MTPTQRDEMAATASVRMAHTQSKTVGIAVNNDLHGERMLKRVRRAARVLRIPVGDSKRETGVIITQVGDGQVNIISADHLTG